MTAFLAVSILISQEQPWCCRKRIQIYLINCRAGPGSESVCRVDWWCCRLGLKTEILLAHLVCSLINSLNLHTAVFNSLCFFFLIFLGYLNSSRCSFFFTPHCISEMFSLVFGLFVPLFTFIPGKILTEQAVCCFLSLGYCQGNGFRVGFGQCSGKILPALSNLWGLE